MRLIVTRPDPDGTRTGRALMALGHVAILSPMIEVIADAAKPLPDGPFQAVLATSSNAVRVLAAHPGRGSLSRLPFLAVGDHSALQAKRAGFAAARSAGGAVDDLVALTVAELRPDHGPLFYAAGDVQAGDLAGRLREQGFQVETAIVYRSVARTRLSAVATTALKAGQADGVLLYSPRSAAAFALALRAAGLAPLSPQVTCFCLSDACAAPLVAVCSGPIRVAEKPDQISLFALIEASRAQSAPPADGAL
jgi:uroporphyrinogen-III synthase